MNENKPIRRHSNLRRFLMYAKYYVLRGLWIPIVIVFGCVVVFFVVLSFCFGCDLVAWLGNAVSRFQYIPKGHILNPLPPAVNEILPEAEVLVRASSVSDTGQKETLLRPAGSADETDPQTLLRASNPTD